MKRNIAIVAGGDTSEIVVSLRSAQGIYSFIDKEKYNLYIVEMEGRRWEVQLPDGNKVPVDRNDFSFMNGTEKVVFDFAYITIHGTPGEDGRLQGYFDMMRIPYSCCGVLAAAITYDKFACNQYLKAFGVRIAESLLLRQGQSVSDEDVLEKIGLPCFIKPSLGGSSFGVTKVKTKETESEAADNFPSGMCRTLRTQPSSRPASLPWIPDPAYPDTSSEWPESPDSCGQTFWQTSAAYKSAESSECIPQW
mgnify:CR=1 FL=1